MSRKNSLHVRSVVFRGLFFFSLVFRRRRLFVLFFFFQERKLRTNRAHPHTHLVFLFLFLVFVPAAPGLSPVLAVRPSFLAFCRGAILGPGRFLDSPGTPLRLFLGREAAWVLLVASLFVVCFFSPSVLFAAAHVFLAGPSRRSRQRGPGWSRPPLGRVIPRGCVFRRGGYGRPLSRTIFGPVVAYGSQGPQGPSLSGGGALMAPPRSFFTRTLVFFSRPRVFFFFCVFFFFKAFGAGRLRWLD